MRFPIALRIVALAFAVASAPIAQAGAPAITLNFQEADIQQVARIIGELTDRTFISDPRVRGKVTVVSADPVGVDRAYGIFLSVLQVHGFTAIEFGNVTKIVPVADARALAGPVIDELDDLPPDQVVTQVVKLKAVSAQQLLGVMRPLMSQYGSMVTLPSGNALVVTDHAANLRRLLEVIARTDTESAGAVEIVPLHEADATDIVRVIGPMFGGKGSDGRTVTLVADARTNSVLVGGDPDARLQVRALLVHLDVPSGDRDSRIVYLHYARADKVAPLLKTMFSDQGKRTSGTDRLDVVLADPDTNALVIVASPPKLKAMLGIVAKLDVRPPQVLIETMFVEMTRDRAAELGVTWAVRAGQGHDAAALTNFGSSGVGVAQAGAAVQAGSIPTPDGLTVGVGRFRSGGVSFAALLRALEGDSTSSILSTPSLVTLDNEAAQLEIGQEVPFLTGQYANLGGSNTGSPFQTIQRKQVGLTLKLTPQINDQGVMVKVDGELSSLAPSSQGSIDQITNKRSVSTSVLAGDGEIVVLGGIDGDELQHAAQRVPVLGSIPMVGNLFSYGKDTVTRRNLMIFLRPKVLADGAAMRDATDGRYDAIRALESQGRKPSAMLTPGATRPELPARETSGPPPKD